MKTFSKNFLILSVLASLTGFAAFAEGTGQQTTDPCHVSADNKDKGNVGAPAPSEPAPAGGTAQPAKN